MLEVLLKLREERWILARSRADVLHVDWGQTCIVTVTA